MGWGEDLGKSGGTWWGEREMMDEEGEGRRARQVIRRRGKVR